MAARQQAWATAAAPPLPPPTRWAGVEAAAGAAACYWLSAAVAWAAGRRRGWRRRRGWHGRRCPGGLVGQRRRMAGGRAVPLLLDHHQLDHRHRVRLVVNGLPRPIPHDQPRRQQGDMHGERHRRRPAQDQPRPAFTHQAQRRAPRGGPWRNPPSPATVGVRTPAPGCQPAVGPNRAPQPAATAKDQSPVHSTSTPCCFALTSGSTWMVISRLFISRFSAASIRSQMACESATVIVPGTTR